MAIVKRKLADGTFVYWVSLRWHGKQLWERSGKDKRAAEREESRIKGRIRDGSYVPKEKVAIHTVAEWAHEWLDGRGTRNAKDDRSALTRYVLSREWLATLPLTKLTHAHADRLIDELKAETSAATGAKLSEKTIANIYGIARTMLRKAARRGLLVGDVFALERGVLDRSAATPRDPYTVAEVERLITCPEISHGVRVWIALAFFTGMREGEVCGRRWRDWSTESTPLGALRVASQYDDQPLKTAKKAGQRARLVPVHPRLAAILDEWKRAGFELTHLRAPTPEDFIVPLRRRGRAAELEPHTKSSAYKMFLAACESAAIASRGVHATRHTFVSFCRRGGAPRDVVERITHNAKGSIVDTYTHFDWAPLCDAVLRMTVAAPVDSPPGLPGGDEWRRRESNRAQSTQLSATTQDRDSAPGGRIIGNSPAASGTAARVGARQHGVGPALHRAKEAALRGDETVCVAEMRRAARLLGGRGGR